MFMNSILLFHSRNLEPILSNLVPASSVDFGMDFGGHIFP